MEEETSFFTVLEIVISVLIIVANTLGNSAIILAIRHSHRKRSMAGNWLIVNLAMCDLLTPLFSMPFDLILKGNGNKWLFGKFMCKYVYPMATLTVSASSLTLAAISLDRYRALMHPFTTRLSSFQVKCLLVTIHLFSALSVVPYVVVLRVDKASGFCQEVGWPSFELRQAYTVGLFLIQYAVPLLFMAVMYVHAARNLFASTRRTSRSDSCIGGMGNSGDRSFQSGPRLMRRLHSILEDKLGRTKAHEHNLKITKIFVVIVILFAVCMLPNQVVWLWLDFGDGSEHKRFSMIASVCQFFTYTNSCLNPVIFYKFSGEFRERLKEINRRATRCTWKTSAMQERRYPTASATKRNLLRPALEVIARSFPTEECKHNKVNPSFPAQSLRSAAVFRANDKISFSKIKLADQEPSNAATGSSSLRCAKEWPSRKFHRAMKHKIGSAIIKIDPTQLQLLPKLPQTDC